MGLILSFNPTAFQTLTEHRNTEHTTLLFFVFFFFTNDTLCVWVIFSPSGEGLLVTFSCSSRVHAFLRRQHVIFPYCLNACCDLGACLLFKSTPRSAATAASEMAGFKNITWNAKQKSQWRISRGRRVPPSFFFFLLLEF